MPRVILDSNIVIGLLNGSLQAEQIVTDHVFISAMTVMEVYALSGISTVEEAKIRNFLFFLDVIKIDEVIAHRAGVLSRTRAHIGKADLLIAATAIEYGIPLISKNLKDFRRIPGLDIRSHF